MKVFAYFECSSLLITVRTMTGKNSAATISNSSGSNPVSPTTVPIKPPLYQASRTFIEPGMSSDMGDKTTTSSSPKEERESMRNDADLLLVLNKSSMLLVPKKKNGDSVKL